MDTIKFELVIRLDKDPDEFVFVTARRASRSTSVSDREIELSVKIPIARLKEMDAVAAEALIGESVLGFFDHLSDGRLGLKKKYNDKA